MQPQRLNDGRAFLREIEESGGVIIRGCRSKDHLRATMQEAIDNGRACVFAPSQKTLRHFMNTSGFACVMSELATQLNNCKVLAVPDCYDSIHLFAVAPQLLRERPEVQ
jgi:hypothetical protein